MNTGQHSGTIFRNMKYFNTRMLKFILLSTTLVIAWGCWNASKIFSHSYILSYQDPPTPQSQVSMNRSVAQYMACFCLNPANDNFKNSIKIGKVTLDEDCFLECSAKSFAWAALTDWTCYCFDRFLPNLGPMVPSNRCNKQKIVYPVDECAGRFTSTEIYRIIQTYKTDEWDIDEYFLGFFPLPANFEEVVQASHEYTSESMCFIYCESIELPLAITNERSCFCGYSQGNFPNEGNRMTPDLLKVDNTNTALVKVWRTMSPDYRCATRIFLPPKTASFASLLSFPGSGNSWIRFLIESATGVFTGSFYSSHRMFNAGCFGEYDDEHSGRTLTSKAHRVTEECKKNSCKTVVLLRNPYNALLAEAAREFYKSKTTPIEEEFLANISTFFLPRVTSKAKGWLNINLMYLQYARPLLVIYYEDLQNDPIKEIRKIVKFIGYEVPHLEERLTCINHDISGPFKRPHSNHGVDPYDKATIMVINQNIKILRDFMQNLKAHDGETLSLPSYERPE
ncbi:sialate:O-sulfotransferase 1-like isoform X1 [Clavelina lepadiformis]|uniref:sialate:O-sulfotransferase 1-like isoform X1 n=1 Tax=Clavelina lepadiformis TaxID=159417 RepID=UPI0040418C7C